MLERFLINCDRLMLMDWPARALTISFLLFGSTLSLGAQSWDGLSDLRNGDEIKVQDVSGKTFKGGFAAVMPVAIRLTTLNGEVVLERTRVRRVEVPSSGRRLRRTLIWAGVGVAVGLVVDQTLGTLFRNETGQGPGVRAATYLAPAGLLGGLAAAFPAYRTVYSIH